MTDTATTPAAPRAPWRPRGRPTGPKLLSGPQRAMLAQIARRAWRRLGGEQIGLSEDAYRRNTALQACGARVSEALATAFDDLFVRYKADAGEVDEAYQRASSRLTNRHRQLLWTIRRDLRGGGLCGSDAAAEAYALAIAVDKWGASSLDALSVSQLEAIRWDCQRAARAHKKRLKEAAAS